MIDVLLIAAGVYVLLLAGMYFGQRALMYHPDQSEPQPQDHGLPQMRALRIAAAGGVGIFAWWQPPADASHPVVVFFHGNAGHIGERDFKLRALVAAGYGVLLTTYRYNAGAGGRPGEAALFADARAVLDHVVAQGVREDRIVLYGESLGSGIAVAMAAERDVAGLILETPYSSVAEVAQSRYWFLPAKWLVRDRYDSLARIGRVRAPILLFHGDADTTIPVRFARKLFAAAPEPKEAHFLPGGSHTDLYDHGAGALVTDFLARLRRR